MTKSKSQQFCATCSIRQAVRAIAVLGVLATISVLPVNAATLHVTDDAFIDLSKPHYRHGNSSKITVGVAGGRHSYWYSRRKRGESHGFAKFDLSPLPDGISSAAIAKATLKIWVSRCRREGSLTLHRIESDWDEDSLSGLNSPGIGKAFATAFVASSDSGNFITFDVTSEVQWWVDNPSSNRGIAFMPMDVQFETDSKESFFGTTRPMEVEVALAGSGTVASGPQGPEGPQGVVGPMGPQGPEGDPGVMGPQGPQGDKGDQGDMGPQGLQGDPGPTGSQGPIGEAGPQGLQGPQGDKGDKGDQGDMGPQGPTGMTGLQGVQGAAGPIGPQGPQGDTGVTGATGPQGSDGPMGPQGLQGDPGPTGSQGPIGQAGPQGLQGLQGDKGDKGDQGDMGPQGPTGSTGLQGEQGLVGATGPQGSTGATGPQGPKGDTGATGPQGEQGEQGLVGATGPQGGTGATGPQGGTGATGPQGPKGDKGDQGIQGLQGDPGVDGSDGSDGNPGPQGPTGPQGDPRATYTVWGQNSCADGRDPLYTGTLASVVGNGGGAANFCLDNTVTASGWVPWIEGMTWRARRSGSSRGEFSNGANTISCAVCPGTAYTHWGSTDCPTSTTDPDYDYTTVYSGYAAAMLAAWSDRLWSTGGPPFCLNETAGSNWTSFDAAGVMRAQGTSGDNRTETQTQNDIRCAVCF